jgi:hypothetical protein
MSNIRFVSRLHHLDEERMMIRVVLAFVHVKEADNGFLAAKDNVAWCLEMVVVYHSTISSYAPSG